MDPHFCSTCGVACSGPTAAVVEEGDGGGDEVELAALDTVNHALDVIETMVEEEEETERVEAVADATVDVVEAEADATVDVVEALTEEEPEPVEDESPEEVEEVVEPETEDTPDEEEGAEEEEPAEGDHTGEATPVEVPPQLEEEATGSRPSGARTTSAFRRRRMKRR
jgi:hypothetical protein